MRSIHRFLAAVVVLVSLGITAAQRTDVFVESRNHPAIAYGTAPLHDPVTELADKLEQGSAQLAFDRDTGYLRSVLDALKISIDSQSLVFSQTSNQAAHIAPENPRAVYFNETAAVGWVRGAGALELAAQDPRQGAVFYTLAQTAAGKPQLKRETSCLLCHLTWDTLGVPGFQMISTFQMSDSPTAYASGIVVDHRSPMNDRWGGWYVTGNAGAAPHRGNVPVVVPAAMLTERPSRTPNLSSVEGRFDTAGFPSRHSDVAALMVLAHQAHMTNLITRVGWEARVAAAAGAAQPPRLEEAIGDVVDYLLFVDEAPFQGPVRGSSSFTERFSAQGPRDSKGRSLHQLDLERRLLRYPCSYMIYTPAFDALPPATKRQIYARMLKILNGREGAPRYARLTQADRQAILEILRETKSDFPAG
jgi:hypothetical protein